MADLAGNLPSPVDADDARDEGPAGEAAQLAEWGARIFGGQRAVEWPVEESSVLGERNGVMAWIEYGLARGSVRTLNALPGPLRRWGVGALARFARLVTPRRGAVAHTFISAAYPELTARERKRWILAAWKHLIHITQASEEIEKRLLGKPLAEHFDLEISPDARRLFNDKAGCLLVTGHLGHWELAPGVLSALAEQPLYVVGKAPKNRPLSKRIQHMREALGVRVLPRRGAMRSIPTVLRGNGQVAMLLDQRAHLKPIIAPFFGRPACCDRSAAVLIRRLKVPIAIGCCFATETPWRFRVVVDRVIQPEELENARAEQVITLVNEEIERLIRRHPEQYFWLHDRFRDAPLPGDKPAVG
ncbi:MAG: KDO2-lipid IV(A) lauroyltransferase [Chlamydiales bacterium]|jgi:KDO2-lipid IV(A) lauroyltransferase